MLWLKMAKIILSRGYRYAQSEQKQNKSNCHRRHTHEKKTKFDQSCMRWNLHLIGYSVSRLLHSFIHWSIEWYTLAHTRCWCLVYHLTSEVKVNVIVWNGTSSMDGCMDGWMDKWWIVRAFTKMFGHRRNREQWACAHTPFFRLYVSNSSLLLTTTVNTSFVQRLNNFKALSRQISDTKNPNRAFVCWLWPFWLTHINTHAKCNVFRISWLLRRD